MLHNTKENFDIDTFTNILSKVRGIYLIPFKTFLVPNARVISSMQIDFNNDQFCQISKYIDTQNRPHILINHTDTAHSKKVPSIYVMYSILLHEVCLRPDGSFAEEFLNNPIIPENSRGYKEMFNRFKKPVDTILSVATIQKMTYNPPDEEKKDITLNLLFRQELSALWLSPEEKRPYSSQQSSIKNTNTYSDNNVSSSYPCLEQIPH
jgi:hypothetical protein